MGEHAADDVDKAAQLTIVTTSYKIGYFSGVLPPFFHVHHELFGIYYNRIIFCLLYLS